MELGNRYTITQVAEQLGVADATLRKWQKDYALKVPRDELGHRYYTELEVEVLQQIIKLKEQGANIHVIKKILSRSTTMEEQNEQALELVTLDKITGAELKEMMLKQIAQTVTEREIALTQQFEEKLLEAKEEITKEIKQELQRQNEQREAENKKLLDAVERLREPKQGLWGKWFGK